MQGGWRYSGGARVGPRVALAASGANSLLERLQDGHPERLSDSTGRSRKKRPLNWREGVVWTRLPSGPDSATACTRRTSAE